MICGIQFKLNILPYCYRFLVAQIDNVFIKQLSWSDGINVPQTNMLTFYFIIVLDLDKNMFCFIFVINGIVHYNFHALGWRIQTLFV